MTLLRTERLQLCTLGPSAAEQVLQYYQRNRAFFRPWLPRYGPNFFSVAFHVHVLQHERRLLKEYKQMRFFLFKLEDTRLSQIIGDIRFARIPTQHWAIATLGYKLDEQQRVQGFMQEALKAAIPFLFQSWNIRKLRAYITPENEPSLRLIQRLGFGKQYKEELYLQLNDAWVPHQCYELSKQDALWL